MVAFDTHHTEVYKRRRIGLITIAVKQDASSARQDQKNGEHRLEYQCVQYAGARN